MTPQTEARTRVGRREGSGHSSNEAEAYPPETRPVLILVGMAWPSQGQPPPGTEGHSIAHLCCGSLPRITVRDGRFII